MPGRATVGCGRGTVPDLLRLARIAVLLTFSDLTGVSLMSGNSLTPVSASLRRPMPFIRSVRTDALGPAAPFEHSGATGDSSKATAFKGERLLAARVDDMVRAIEARWPV